MARSIHTTRRELRELSREKFDDSKQKKTALEDVAEPLYRKRRIKRMVKNDRRPHFPPSALTEANAVPVVTRDESEFVHHGASPADVQAILDAIPGSARLS